MGYLLILLILRRTRGHLRKFCEPVQFQCCGFWRREGLVVQEANAGASGFPPARTAQGHWIKTMGLFQGNIKMYFSFQLERSTYVYRV